MTAVLNSTITARPFVASATSATPRARQPRLRITARGRLVLTLLVGIPLAVAVFLGNLNGGGATASLDAGELSYVTVDSGETLWGLAESIAPSSDPRDVIAEIVDLNRLATADVFAGQRLAIPAAYAN